MSASSTFRRVGIESLRVEDERSFRDVEIYARLKDALLRDGYRFRVPAQSSSSREPQRADWNRALLLNLGFWSADDPADVLVEERVPADVVAHVAWHHLAHRALGPGGATVDGLLLGESVASAFDLYLVGRLLGSAPRSTFLKSQVPAMAEVARSAGVRADDFASLLADIAGDPEAAFSDLRALLFVASTRLARARGIDQAARILDGLSTHRFHALLHHYNLSNWILYVRAWAGAPPSRVDGEISRVDRALRRPGAALAWLDKNWLRGSPERRRKK